MEELLAIESAALGTLWAIAPLAGMAAIALCLGICAATGRKPGAASIGWAIPFAGILAFLAAWCIQGLCMVEPAMFGAASAIACASGCIATATHAFAHARAEDSIAMPAAFAAGNQQAKAQSAPAHAKHARTSPGQEPAIAKPAQETRAGRGAAVLRNAAMLCVAALATTAAIECASNPAWLGIPLHLLVVESGIVLMILAAAYFLGQRHGAAAAIVVAACTIAGIAENFIVRFRGSPIQPSDLFALQTAATVAEGYTYSIDNAICASICFATLALLALSFAHPAPKLHPAGTSRAAGARAFGRVAANLACAIAFGAAAVLCVTQPSYEDDLNVEISLYKPLRLYRANGFVPSFIAHAQTMRMQAPEGYTPELASSLEQELARAWDQRMASQQPQEDATPPSALPNIVVVMNESYADLSLFDGLQAGYPGPWLTTEGKAAALDEGQLAVPPHGGGTCNSEFEFLTGNPIGLLGPGKVPFVQYQLDGVDSIVRQLDQLGYLSSGVHPYMPENWNRQQRYLELGFDRTYFYDEFEGTPTYRTFVSDATVYNFILDKLEEADQPQFFFEVSMQNHGGYDADLMQGAEVHRYTSIDYSPDATANQVNEYLTCLDESDRALKEFMGNLGQLDEPTVVLFFGDHQPNLTRYVGEAVFPQQSDLEETVRLHLTFYWMWANYELKGNVQPAGVGSSAFNLDTRLLQLLGLPLSDYQKARAELAHSIPMQASTCYQGADGTWYAIDDETSPYAEQLRQLELIEYLHCGSRV